MGTFDDIIKQIDAFIRKFYKNQMIKGLLLFLIIFLSTFLLVSGLEYIGHFNSFIRGVLLFSFIGLNTYVLFKYFIIPTFKLFSFGKRIDKYQAAKIIGDFFPDIDDRLLNTLQLKDAAKDHPRNIQFIYAGIEQNAGQLNKFSFISAIDYSSNSKFLKYFFPVLLIVILTGIFIPDILTKSSERLIKYNSVFEIAPDFSFELQNKNLTVEEGNEITIELLIKPLPGKSVPEKIYIESSEGNFLMKKIANNKAAYTFNNLNNDINFYFKALNAQSKSYKIDVIKRTSIGHLNVAVNYPDYIQRKSETIENPGDLILPEGSKLTWNGITKNAKSLQIITQDTSTRFENPGFRFSHNVNKTSELLFVLENKEIVKYDSNFYHIDVIKDEYPGISVSRFEDSIIKNKIYFSGNVSDDYGLNQLIFTYIIEKEDGTNQTKNTVVPGISGKQSPFSMTFNLDELGLELKDKVSYFFTVYDNDGVNGSKATKSNVFQYLSPSLQELQEKRSQEKDKSVEELKELIRESKEFKEELARFKKEMMNSKQSSWQQQQQMKNLQEQKQSLENRIQQTKEQMKSSFEEKTKLSPMDEKLLEKQKIIEDLLDSVMDEELQKLLEELQKMLEQNMDMNLLEKLEESEMSAEEMERQLDRTLEMLKRMDVEERVEDLQKSLEQLSDEQNQLKDELDDADASDKEDMSQKQSELNEQFEKIKEDFQEMLEKNEELKRPMFFDGLDELMDEIADEMQKAQDEIENENNSSAQEKQEKASDKMEQAAAQLQAQVQQNQAQQNEEDMRAIRALLENLIRLSFDQESNLISFKEVNPYDPYFVTLGREQRAIMDNFLPVKDSLKALANRIPEIASFIEQELKNIDKQYRYIPTHIGERERAQLIAKQQFAMTGFNNLALFLNEALENAQQQMLASQQGDGTCDKPGEGNPKQGKSGKGKSGESDMNGIKEMIKKQLEELKKGSQQGGQQPNMKPGGLLPINSQQAAKMAAEQDAIRQKLQEIREQLNKDGSGSGNQLNELLKQLEKQQEDLINKQWNTELINRQQEILTRLLDSENAIRERDWDEERESNSGKDEDYSNQIQFLEYKYQKEKQVELLRTLDPSFSQYYREKANEYFLNIE